MDASATKRDLRAESMRKLGMEVDCAADISEARSWWRADLYSLVLIDMESGLGHRDQFCDEMRRATPPQQISFLVGKPGYLADATERGPSTEGCGEQGSGSWADVKTALAADLPGKRAQRWGILEASRRISAVRSLSHARTESDAGPACRAARSGNQGVETGRGGIQDFRTRNFGNQDFGNQNFR